MSEPVLPAAIRRYQEAHHPTRCRPRGVLSERLRPRRGHDHAGLDEIRGRLVSRSPSLAPCHRAQRNEARLRFLIGGRST